MGGSSGGGSSGAVIYEPYISSVHADWLDRTSTDNITSSITDLMNTAIGATNPFAGVTSIDPDADITTFQAAVNAFSTFVLAIDPENNWESYIGSATSYIDASVLDETTLTADIAANDAIIDDRITSDILPRFQTGMRDINAVISSSFTLGQSNIEAFAQRDKNKYASELRLSNYKQRNTMIIESTKDILNLFIQKTEYYKIANHYLVEAARIKTVMLVEELEQQTVYDEKDALWDMSAFQYGANVMAAIAGAATTTRGSHPSTEQKVMGGVLSGVAAGAAVGGPAGATIGGIIGGIGGFLT